MKSYQNIHSQIKANTGISENIIYEIIEKLIQTIMREQECEILIGYKATYSVDSITITKTDK